MLLGSSIARNFWPKIEKNIKFLYKVQIGIKNMDGCSLKNYYHMELIAKFGKIFLWVIVALAMTWICPEKTLVSA